MSPSSPPVSITLAQIHRLVGGELHGDGGTRLSALASLTEATRMALEGEVDRLPFAAQTERPHRALNELVVDVDVRPTHVRTVHRLYTRKV